MEVSENVKMISEECLDNLLNTRDITVYLECLSALKDNYLIVATVKDTLGSNMPEKALDLLHGLGFAKITTVLHKMYVGVCGKGGIIADITGEKPDVTVEFKGEFNGIAFSASSKSWSSGNNGDILINGTNYSLNSRGLNIVVFDCEKNKAIDSVGYDSYLATPTFYHKNLEFDDAFFDSHFYIPKKYMDIWKAPYSKRYFSNRKLGVQEIENGIILPNKVINNAVYGGVCDENFNFISGHSTFFSVKDGATRHISGAYKVPTDSIKYYEETVVYGGTLLDHPGHLIAESFADRVWWFVKNSTICIKVAFVDMWGDNTAKFSKEFLELLDIPENRMVICHQPSQFKKIIIPEQSATPLHAIVPYEYTQGVSMVYRHMASKVSPSHFKKIYFTKRCTDKKNVVGEDYFIEFYRKKGFKIIDPEHYTLKEKIEFLIDADEFVTIVGTNSLYAVFCKPTVKLTILTRVKDDPVEIQAFISEVAHIKNIYYIDVSMSFLQRKLSWGVCLLGATTEFERYIKDTYNEEIDVTQEESLKNNLYKYLKWFIEYNTSSTCFNFIKNQKMLSILQMMSEVFCGRDFDTSGLDLTTNEDNLRVQVKQLTADLEKSKKYITELENTDANKTAKLLDATNVKFEKQVSNLKAAIEMLPNLQSKIDELSKENLELAKSVMFSRQALEIQERDFRLTEEHLQKDLNAAKEMNTKLLARVEEIKSENSELDFQNSNLKNRINDFERSHSWRITKPMRSTARFFRKLFGGKKQQ